MGPGIPYEDQQAAIGQQIVPVQPKATEISLPMQKPPDWDNLPTKLLDVMEGARRHQ